MVGFIFGGDTKETPETLKRKREIAAALLGQSRAPKNVGEGLQAIGDALIYRSIASDADKGEAAGRKSAESAFSSLFGGGAASADAPSPTAGIPAGSALDISLNKTASPVFANDGTELGAYLSDPERRSTLPAGMRNNNPGNIKFVGQKVPGIVGPSENTDQGDPQAVFDTPESGMRAMYGLLGKKYAGGKLTPNQMIAGNMGWTPGNFEAAKNVARYAGIGPDDDIGFSDPAKAAKFMRGLILQEHGNRGTLYPESLIASVVGAQQPQQPQQPVEVASAQPMTASDAIASQAPKVPSVQTGYVDPQVTTASRGPVQALTAPPQAAPQLPPATNVASAPPVAAVPQQVAQAAPQQTPAQALAGGGPSMQQLIQASQNEFLSDGQRSVVNALLKQKMEEADPLRQLQIQQAQMELDQGRAPKERKTIVINGRLVDSETGKEIANFPDEPKKPAGVQEYEYAKGQGFPGTYQDWEASKKGGMSLQVDPATGQVTFQQGSNIKPMTEAQSKDTTFATRAEGALPTVDQFGDALTSLGETAGGSVPVIGNYMKSPEFQKAEQAGKEFLQAILRKDTGAAITKGETDEYGSVYLPRPGDSKELLDQKKTSRRRALEAMKAGMTPQAILAQEKALAATPAPAAPPPAAENPLPPTPSALENMPAPEGMDPNVWKFVPPEDRKLWQN